ncbi:MAG TPA: LysR family transcriptional regulator [Rhizobiaceae bacterium]|nr:LysR family transcriptional regulator [Rhizobiaceae bacterium]
MLDRMDLLLRFKAIAEAGSMRRAAEALHITQPALSRSVRQLEHVYKQPLFERHARGLVPTEFGLKLLSTISRLSRDWELAEIELREGSVDVGSVLRVNAGPIWASLVLPVVMARLHQLFPNLVIELTTELSSQTGSLVRTALIEGRLDVSLSGLHGNTDLRKDFIAQPFTPVRDRIIANLNHPIHRHRPDDYGVVHDFPWITYSADPVYEAGTQHSIIERTGSPPRIVARFSSLLAILRLLQEGNYLCMLPDLVVSGMFGAALKVAPTDLGHRSGVSGAVYRKSLADYAPLKQMLSLCEAYFESR